MTNKDFEQIEVNYYKTKFNMEFGKLDYTTRMNKIKAIKKGLVELEKCYKAENILR